MKKTILFGLLFVLLIAGVSALRNPAAVYCEALGYEYSVESTAEGDTGYCKVSARTKLPGWKFLLGEEGERYSYCQQEGYELRVVEDSEKCSVFMTDTCAVCVLEDGSEVEVTELMNLSFAETTCGDGVCGVPENYESCPSDCPSGSEDAYCDAESDGICDSDCEASKDPDCGSTGLNTWLFVGLLAAIALALLAWKKKKKNN